MQGNRHLRRWLVASASPLFVMIVSCSSEDFRKVQAFAGGATTVNDGFKLVATDFYDSCVRSARFTVLGLRGAEKAFDQREQAVKDCDAEQALQPALLNANAILVNYMVALGNLAGDRPVDFGPNIRKLGDSVTRISQFSPEDVQAATSIVDWLFKMWSDNYRRAKLKEVVVGTDSSLQTYVVGLKKIVDRGYIDSHLVAEQSAVNKYYKDYLSAQYTTNAGMKSLMIPVVDDAWRTKQETIDKRIALARAYSAVLTEVADTHADLKKVFAGGTAVAAEPCPGECETDGRMLAEANRVIESHARALEPLVKNLEQTLQSARQSS